MTETTLPSLTYFAAPGFQVREISSDPAFHAAIWQWHARRPGWNPSVEAGPDEYLGDNWRNWCFFFDGEPRVCVSVEERRPYGFECHIASAPKTHPDRVRFAARWIGDLLMAQGPSVRIATWVMKENRAAMRFNRRILEYEAETEVEGNIWCRFGADNQRWDQKHHEQA